MWNKSSCCFAWACADCCRHKSILHRDLVGQSRLLPPLRIVALRRLARQLCVGPCRLLPPQIYSSQRPHGSEPTVAAIEKSGSEPTVAAATGPVSAPAKANADVSLPLAVLSELPSLTAAALERVFPNRQSLAQQADGFGEAMVSLLPWVQPRL